MTAIDTNTRILLETIGNAGYVVELTYATGHVCIATNETTGERFMVRAADLYRAACELAQAVGVDLGVGETSSATQSYRRRRGADNGKAGGPIALNSSLSPA